MISNFISFKKKILNKKIEKLFFYLMWIGIIVSINTNSSLLYLKSYKFFEIINFLRALSPLVIFIILSWYLLKNIKNFNLFKNRNTQLNIICICIISYSLISTFGLFLNNDQFIFDRIWWNISYLNVLIYLYLGSQLFGYKFLKDILLILLLFIFCFYTFIAFMTIKQSILLKLQNVYHSSLLAPETYILGQGLPRTSGVARALFFLFLLHLSLLCFKKNFFYINLFFCVLYAWVVSVFDSRITTIFYYISLLVIFYSKLYFLKKIVIFLILILIFNNSHHIYGYISILQNKSIEKQIILKKRSEKLVSNFYNNYLIDVAEDNQDNQDNQDNTEVKNALKTELKFKDSSLLIPTDSNIIFFQNHLNVIKIILLTLIVQVDYVFGLII